MESDIHNTGFLISPTTHLFPLSGQSGSCGVVLNYFKTLDMEYGINNKSKYTTLQIRTTLDCKKKERKAKKRHGHKSPQGGW